MTTTSTTRPRRGGRGRPAADPGGRTGSRQSRGGWWLLVLCVLLTGLAAVANQATPAGRPGVVPATLEDFVDAVAALTFPWVGALLLCRRGNRVGWVFGVVGLAMATTSAAGAVTGYRIATGGWAGVAVLQLLLEFMFMIFIGSILILLPLLLPDGRLRSPRWRPVLWAGWGWQLLAVLSICLRPGPVEDETPLIRNPFGVEALRGFPGEEVTFVLLVVLSVAGLASLVLRFARPLGVEERRQIRLLFLGVVVCLIPFSLDGVLQPVVPGWGPLAPLVAIPAVPLAAYLALVRSTPHRVDG